QERPERVECILPSERRKRPRLLPLSRDYRLAVRHRRTAPGPRDDQRSLSLDDELGSDDAGIGIVEVPPAVHPGLRALLPPVVPIGEQELERLGEARLAGAVPADDEREPGT